MQHFERTLLQYTANLALWVLSIKPSNFSQDSTDISIWRIASVIIQRQRYTQYYTGELEKSLPRGLGNSHYYLTVDMWAV
jgi:hypothetical protein